MPVPKAATRTADPDRRFFKAAMTVPLLERDEELALARAWKEEGDQAALHRIANAYMRLVIAVAARFRHYGLPFPDLVQEGVIGLMQAAARFEPERNLRFSTYASWWIRSSVQDYVLRNWSIVRTGTTSSQKSLFFNLRRLRARINDTGSGALAPEHRAYVATALKVGEDDVESMAARLAAVDRSLNAPFSENGDGQWQDLVPDENPDPETAVMASRDGLTRSRWLAEALSRLSEREQLIIRQRRLVDESVTLEKLGERLGISKERVRQIEHHALGKLKTFIEEAAGAEAELVPAQ